jgi:hypothetical protein
MAQGKTVDFPILGKFVSRNNEEIIFVPSLEFLDGGRFKLLEDDNNISPLSNCVPKTYVSKLSLAEISSEAGVSQHVLMKVFKDIIQKFVAVCKLGKECMMNMKIGNLHYYSSGEICFE